MCWSCTVGLVLADFSSESILLKRSAKFSSSIVWALRSAFMSVIGVCAILSEEAGESGPNFGLGILGPVPLAEKSLRIGLVKTMLVVFKAGGLGGRGSQVMGPEENGWTRWTQKVIS